MIYVCTPAAGNCCCGNLAKRNAAIDWPARQAAWRAHPISARMRLLATKCLGPCEAANVVLVRFGLQSHWFREVRNDDMDAVFDYGLRLSEGRATPGDGIETRRFTPETILERSARDDTLSPDVAELVQRHLLDERSGWSCGSFGAVAEFVRSAGENAHFDLVRRHAVATERGALLVVPTRAIRPIAFEAPAGERDEWQQGIALCLPADACAMNERRVVTELGPDARAVRAEDRCDILFDLGLGVLQTDVCVRTSDQRTLQRLRASEGLSLFAPGNELAAALRGLSAHRVFMSRFGRVEVYRPSPPADGKSPDGPHTRVLPKLFSSGRTHAANLMIPRGWVPCMMTFPANPLRDRLGERKAFDRGDYTRFSADWERFAAPGLVAFKHDVTTAIRAAKALPVATSRAERTTLEVAIRQARQLCAATIAG